MLKIDQATAPRRQGSNYPVPFDRPCATRTALSLGDAGGLMQFGAHLVALPRGAWSSQRHHHSAEDECVYILTGRPSLIDDGGEQKLSPGDCTAHPAGEGNGHHMINRTDQDVTFLVIGSRRPEVDSGVYPDIDLDIPASGTRDRTYRHNDGRPY